MRAAISFAIGMLLTGGTVAATAATRAEILGPCGDRLPGLEEALCGTYPVWENRQARTGRRIDLNIVVLPATGPQRAPDAITYLAGGPGDNATGAAEGLATIDPEIRETRDILLVDMRGTGKSNPLQCSYQEGEINMSSFLPLDGVKKCWQELSPIADLTQYRTDAAVDDLDEVREALGYEQLDLVGGSYGTRASLVFMRRHPQRARTAILFGPVSHSVTMPMTFARDAQTALDGWFEECGEDIACGAAFPSIDDEFWAVQHRLENDGPVMVSVQDPKTGKPREMEISDHSFEQTIRYMTYLSGTSLQIPAYVHAAASGNFEPLAGMTLLFSGFLGGLPDGLYLSITCAEDLPWVDRAEGARQAEGTYLGDFRVREQKDACEAWPVGTVDAAFHEPVVSDVPTLVIVGERDPVTPPWSAREIAPYLSHSALLVVPDGGHDHGGLQGTECIEALQSQVILTGSTDGLDIAGCAAAISRPAFTLDVTREEAVELDAEQLRRVTGTYRGVEQPILVEVEVVDGKLRMVVADQPPTWMTPVSATRFRIEGAPPGFYLNLELDGDSVAGLVLEQGSFGPPQTLRREP